MNSEGLTLRDMTAGDLDAVTLMEQEIHAYPWTLGNFKDALDAGYVCKVCESEGDVAGYLVLMPALDEMELLDIGIAAAHQRQGWGRKLLHEALGIARQRNMVRMLLEVRPTNIAALRLYERAGFSEIGRRRGYYPAVTGREDAIMMECRL